MINPFRTRARIGMVAGKFYTVYYRKWWQKRWRNVMRGRYPYLTSYKKLAQELANQIENGEGDA